jgi:hypothetical protein
LQEKVKMAKKYEESFISSIKIAIKYLRGYSKRQYLAEIAMQYFDNSARKMEAHLGVKRSMVELGIAEYRTGIRCVENFSMRGRKKKSQYTQD